MAVVAEDFLKRSKLTVLQSERLRELLAAILPHNRFYARKFAEAGLTAADIHTPADLRRLPFTTKAELLADQEADPPYGQALTYRLGRYCRLHQTSGSTGRALRWLDTAESWQWMLGCWQTIYRITGVGPEDTLFFPFSFGPFLGFWTAFEAAGRLGSLILAGGGMSSMARLRLLLENRATVVLCTPTYALHLAEVADQHGMDLAGSPVRQLIVAGEPGGSIPATRARLEEAWGARVYDHSGMTEVGPFSIECPNRPGGLHLLEGHYLAEVIDPDSGREVSPGEVGELVITNLGRWGSPLLRYRTGDLVRPAADASCGCGRSWLFLEGGILGRTDGLIHVRGNNVYPTALEAVIRSFAAVAEYAVCVDQSGPLTAVRIEVEPRTPSLAEGLADQVSQAIRDSLLFRAEVTAVAPGSLPRFEMKAQRVRVRIAD